jgi:hypothetical protein
VRPFARVMIALGLAVLLLAPTAPVAAQQLLKLKVAFCTRTIDAAVAPFAAAMRMGWYRQEGFDVEVIPLPGSTDCVKFVVTREMDFSLPSIEPIAIGRPQGLKWGIIKERVDVKDLVTNELIDEINRFDAAAIAAEARAWKPGR